MSTRVPSHLLNQYSATSISHHQDSLSLACNLLLNNPLLSNLLNLSPDSLFTANSPFSIIHIRLPLESGSIILLLKTSPNVKMVRWTNELDGKFLSLVLKKLDIHVSGEKWVEIASEMGDGLTAKACR